MQMALDKYEKFSLAPDGQNESLVIYLSEIMDFCEKKLIQRNLMIYKMMLLKALASMTRFVEMQISSTKQTQVLERFEISEEDLEFSLLSLGILTVNTCGFIISSFESEEMAPKQ